MKTFEIKYYEFDPINDLWHYNYRLNITAEELAEFIIDRAYDQQTKIYEVKEITK